MFYVHTEASANPPHALEMVKDAEELPVILSELEESTALIGDSW